VVASSRHGMTAAEHDAAHGQTIGRLTRIRKTSRPSTRVTPPLHAAWRAGPGFPPADFANRHPWSR
jgi:hypothetical protein